MVVEEVARGSVVVETVRVEAVLLVIEMVELEEVTEVLELVCVVSVRDVKVEDVVVVDTSSSA